MVTKLNWTSNKVKLSNVCAVFKIKSIKAMPNPFVLNNKIYFN